VILHSTPFMAQLVTLYLPWPTSIPPVNLAHFYKNTQQVTLKYQQLPSQKNKTNQEMHVMIQLTIFCLPFKECIFKFHYPTVLFFFFFLGGGGGHNFALHFRDKCACTCLHTFTHSARPQSVLSCTSEYAVANSKHVKYFSLKRRFLCTLQCGSIDIHTSCNSKSCYSPLIIGRSLFMRFLFAWFQFNATWKLTPLFEIYVINFGFMQYGIDNPWRYFFCVRG